MKTYGVGRGIIAWSLLLVATLPTRAQAVLETGGQNMPDTWIDRDTHHKVIRLTRLEGNNASFYFHNNPFFGNNMVFYNTGKNGKQVYFVNLETLQTKQVTHSSSPMTGEMVGARSNSIYYQVKDSVFASNPQTQKARLLYVFPEGFKATISTVNADETLLAGRYSSGEAEKEILRQYPEKSQFFNRIFDAKILNTLFTVNIKTGELKKIHNENTWLGHVQFSPSDPALLMFCHEGPWHKVDRIWTINVKDGNIKLMHKRSVDMEIAGHEFFSADGQTIWFDLQVPRSENFFLAGVNVKNGEEKRYRMTRNEWSIHFNVSKDGSLFCGDGGDPDQVAKASDGRWIYLFHPEGDHFRSERLVNMKNHGYKLEPNVHFSPDQRWVIFRANFEGSEQVYAVEVKAGNKQ